MLSTLIKDYNKLLSEYRAGERLDYPHWKDFILLPLVREVGMRLNMEYEVSGVFGLRLECYITVKDENNSYICCTTPGFCGDEFFSLYYDTGERIKPRHNDLNGFDNVVKPLPESIEELIELMKEREGTGDED